MLDLLAVQEQLQEYRRFQVEEEVARTSRMTRAMEALQASSANWEALAGAVDRQPPGRLLVHLIGDPAAAISPEPRPSAVTVAATDGSQIYPDRHLEPTCYLLNVSRIVFHYGTLEAPVMASRPHVKFRARDVADLAGDGFETASEDVVSALRDELELTELLEAARTARVAGRPIVAVSDGTLIRWMLRGLGNRALEQRLIEGFTRTLAGFREAGIPICSYISFPANTEFAHTLGVYLEAFEQAPDARQLDGLLDQWIFGRHLAPGERSALFGSQSRIQREYRIDDQIYFFYMKTETPAGTPEIARVEIPYWVARQPEAVALVHSVLLDECRKGRGYPMILSEAHEQAVVRTADRALFYEMLDGMMARAGHVSAGSMKRASKQQPLV